MKNIGIIGCGKIAQTRHIPEYMDNQDSRLAAFYDVNAERARFLAKKYGGRAYGCLLYTSRCVSETGCTLTSV